VNQETRWPTPIERAATRIMDLYESRQAEGYDAPTFKEIVEIISTPQPPAPEPTDELRKLADALQNEIDDSASLAQQYRTILEYMTKAFVLGEAAPEQPVSTGPREIEQWLVETYQTARTLIQRDTLPLRHAPDGPVKHTISQIIEAYAAPLRHEIAALRAEFGAKIVEQAGQKLALEAEITALKEENVRLSRPTVRHSDERWRQIERELNAEIEALRSRIAELEGKK
jgi:hypothetical protein